MRGQMKRIYLIVALAALIALSSLAVAASGPARVPVAPALVYVYWCHGTSEEKTCSGSTTARPGKLDPRAR